MWFAWRRPQVVTALAIIQLAPRPGWPNLFARHPVANLANLAPPKRRGPFICLPRNNNFELGLLRNDGVTGGVLFRGGLSISRRHPHSPKTVWRRQFRPTAVSWQPWGKRWSPRSQTVFRRGLFFKTPVFQKRIATFFQIEVTPS